jgi:HTH-type transcriptional repressor of NAD biosynthesis genes
VVGKFSPLHLGHELLIRRAMTECDETILISYSRPELSGCEPARREQWLRARFPEATVLVLDGDVHPLPQNDADALVHRRYVGKLCVEVLGKTVDAVFTSEDYGDGFAEELGRYFSSRCGGAHHPVAHVLVDRARIAVPVSGTKIRSDPHALRAFMAGEVYASFVQTVCFIGGESSGKTTMARLMAERCATVWAPEYGRELWVEKSGALAYDDMARIATAQQQREDTLRREASRFLFCDTSALTTLFYSLEMFGTAEPSLARMAEREYDHVFLCAPGAILYEREIRREPGFRERQHDWYLAELDRRRITHTLLSGPVHHRIATVMSGAR